MSAPDAGALQKAIAKLWERIVPLDENSCWIWPGSKVRFGYGVIRVDGKTFATHRVAFLSRNGEIPAGLLVRHTCDVPACCNPRHLLTGTHKENTDDMRLRGRSHNNPGKNSEKTERAFKLIAKGLTPYAAALKVGISLSTIYRAIARKKEPQNSGSNSPQRAD